MNVLIADRLREDARASLSEAGFTVIYDPDLKDGSLIEAIAETGADVLVVRSTRVNGDALTAGRLRLVIRAGAGYNTIDVKTAVERSIYVSNCPGGNSNSVAELAFGLIIALDRRIPENVEDLKQGIWNKLAYSSARGLWGSTLGLVGVGRVGASMIPRARAFGMSVCGWSRSLTPARALELGIHREAALLDVAASSDLVSIHVALTADTRHMIGEEFFESMRHGAMLINTSRDEVVDEKALATAVKSKGIRAGLDVFTGEPSAGAGTIDNELFALEGVIGTHHIGGQTLEAQRAVAEETVRIIREFDSTGVPPNLVS